MENNLLSWISYSDISNSIIKWINDIHSLVSFGTKLKWINCQNGCKKATVYEGLDTFDILIKQNVIKSTCVITQCFPSLYIYLIWR